MQFTAMKWLALFSVITIVGQLQAYPNSERTKIVNEHDVEAMEEVLLAQLLRMKQESLQMGINNVLKDDETALEQTNALCPDPDECNCRLKVRNEPEGNCVTFDVPYCEGPCRSEHRYN